MFFIKHASSKSGEDGDGTCIVGKRSRYEKQADTFIEFLIYYALSSLGDKKGITIVIILSKIN